MNLKRIKKWLLGISIGLVIVIVGSVIFINYELKHMFGGYAEVVDSSQFDVPSKSTVITNVNILSPDGSHFIEHQNVWLENDEITRIDTSRQIPEDHIIVNGKGKYLIPGLIDAHVHTWKSPNDLLLYLVNGVTHIRELMGSPNHLKWRQEIENGKRLGPQMFVASNKVQSFGRFEGWFMNWMQGNINQHKADHAITMLEELSNEGYDAVKLGSFLNKENYLAVSSAAEKINIPLVGHLSFSVGFKELWSSNQKEVAHIEEIVKTLRNEFGRVTIENKKEFLQFIKKRGDQVSNKLIENNIAVGSTIWLSESFIKQKMDLKNLLTKIQLPYVNPGILEGTKLTKALGWIPSRNPYCLPENISSDKLLIENNYWSAYAEAHQILVGIFAKKGVKILAGTDANLPVVVPGFSLHDELNALSMAGMTNAQALHAATNIPAEWMNVKSGVILPNYQADLVLLNKNPLDRIENTTTIETVILNGKVFDRNKLDAILNAVRKANDRSRKMDISSFAVPLDKI